MLLQAILEGLGLGALLVLVCAIGIHKGAVGMAHLYDSKVQERCVALGLTTKEKIKQNALRFKLIGCCGVNSFYPQCRRLWMKKYRFRFGSSTQIQKIGRLECWADQQQILHDEIVLRTIRDDGEVPDSLSQP